MSTSEANKSASVVCPRCGYDLRGQVDAWHPGFSAWLDAARVESRDSLAPDNEESVGASCPLKATCSECGLTFEWADLFAPVRQVTRLYEVDEKQRVRALLVTLWRLMLCWPLWNRLKMQHEIRHERIAVVILSCLAMWYLAVAVPWFLFVNAGAIESLLLKGQISGRWGNSYFDFQQFVPFRSVLSASSWRTLLPSTWFSLAVVQWLLMPICFLLLPISLQKAKVRRVHLLRGIGYSTGWLMLMLHLPALIVLPYTVLRLVQMPNFLAFPSRNFVRQTPWMIAVYCIVLSAIWWSVFAGKYLKLPRPWLIGLVLAIVAALFAVSFFGLAGKGPELVMNTV